MLIIRYAAFDGELSWAPDIRYGLFSNSYEWQGGVVIQDISCCHLGAGTN
jgi:hypothetical protein